MEGRAHIVDGDVAAEADGETARLGGLVETCGLMNAETGGRDGSHPPELRATSSAALRHRVIGSGISFAGIVATSSSTSLSLASFLMRKWIHVLQRLVILLAEGHGALGRVEAQAFHGGDQLLGIGRAGLLSAATTAAAAAKPPATKKSGGAL